jgi:ABC-type uncharacterized transport system
MDSTRSSGPVAWLAANRGTGGLALIALGALLAVIPAVLAAKTGGEFILVTILTGALALLVLAIGVLVRYTPGTAGEGTEVHELIRILLLALGGGCGLLITLIGVALHYYWWTDLTNLIRLGDREKAWHVFLPLALLVAGLAVMFVSVQVVRSEERASAVLRRLLYGYNAVLTGLLLLLILGVVNVLVGLKFTGVIDATQSGQFTLSDRTANILKGLTQPVRVYVIWPTDDDTMEPIKNLLGNFEDVAPNLKVDYLSPLYNRDALAELMRKYPRKIEERVGVLVVQGEEKPENATFLKYTDLFADEGFGATAQTKFRGEDKLVSTLAGAGAGQGKTVVYVTQGAGEPDLNDASLREADKGLGALRDRLNQRGNLDVRPLKLNPADPKVPDDCNVLVVANPKAPAAVPLEREVRTYLTERRGKAVFLLDVPPEGAEPAAVATGWEGLLGEFGVEVANTRVITVMARGGDASPEDAGVFEVSESLVRSRNDLARAFANRQFVLPSARVVRPGGMGRNPAVRAEPLLVTTEGALVWAESDPAANLFQKLRMVLTNRAEAERIVAKQPLSGAVVVTESAPVPPMPGHEPPAAKPRLVVFGDTTWVSNPYASERSGRPNAAFFASTLDWLAERSASIGVESKALPTFVLEPSALDRSTRIYFLPLVLALVGIVGLGAGVWVVRRR